MKFVNKFHSNSILPFSICRIKSGSVIQTKHFDIKMSLEIRQAKSFFFTLWVMFFASFHFFIFFILRITINCNYLFTKHFKYKTLIYLCQRPPPKNLLFFICTRGGWGKMVMWLCFGRLWGACSGRLRRNCTKYQATMLSWYFCGVSWYLHDWDIRYRRCFSGCCGICMDGIFAVADAFFLPVMYNYIFNLPIS